MVQNAKDYNTTGSDIYEDAERIRKLVYNYMKINNSEYTDNPQYVSFPTPLPRPGENPNRQYEDPANDQPEAGPAPLRRSTAPATSEPPDRKSSIAPSATTGEGNDDGDFTGKTFQEAQQMIISRLLHHTDEESARHRVPVDQ